ncbi:MAG: hypothetical protein COA68_05545 [Oceanobacter sp.]|nr:MAG: hypothetical protein COA68_05545 [Oceanobacter sp.]
MAIEYPELADLWEESGCFQTPSALHGWLSGYLASGARLAPESWLKEAADYLEVDDLPEALSKAVIDMYVQVVEQLSAEDMDFNLLLPDDEEADVDEQVECLAQWSKGFLDGIGASGKLTRTPDKDVFEVLQDLDAFSQAHIEDINDPDNAELYLGLTEHARVAAMTVFYAYNQPAPSTSGVSPKTLH